MLDAWRLSVGTLTAVRVGHPSTVDRRTAGLAMLMAPVAVVPLGVPVGLVCWAGRELELAPLAVAAVAVGALAMGSRALHLDGMSDVADALTDLDEDVDLEDRDRDQQHHEQGQRPPLSLIHISEPTRRS